MNPDFELVRSEVEAAHQEDERRLEEEHEEVERIRKLISDNVSSARCDMVFARAFAQEFAHQAIRHNTKKHLRLLLDISRAFADYANELDEATP